MASFCLPREYVDAFKIAIRDGDITPELLMYESDGSTPRTTQSRIELLVPFTGKGNAKEVNQLIESKLILKNWKKGLQTAIRDITGMKPEKKNDLVTRIERMESILTPTEEGAFLEGLASKKLETEVTKEEMTQIVERIKEVQKANSKFEESNTYEDRINAGLKRLELEEYVTSINPNVNSILEEIIGIPRALMSFADLSALLRQGWGLMTDKLLWQNIPNMLRYTVSAFGGTDYYKILKAEIITDPLYESARRGGLRLSALNSKLSQKEESYMTNIFQKVRNTSVGGAVGASQQVFNKTIGGLMEGSQRGYEGFLNKIRFDKFKQMVRAAELAGENVKPNSQTVKDIAAMVNMLTGSGNLGPGDRWASVVPLANALFFAPRKISSTLQMFYPGTYINTSKTARKEGIRQLLGSLGATATLLTLAQLMRPDEEDTVELDPRSSDFGKIKIGNTRYDMSGGNANLLVLLARVITQRTKSSSTGVIKKLGDGFGSTTGDELVLRYFTNKTSPVASLFLSIAKGKDFDGQPLDIKKELISRMYPLFIQDVAEVMKEDKSQTVFAILAGFFGVGLGTYGMNNKDAYIQDAFDKYGKAGSSKALKEVYKKIEEDEEKPVSDAQKTNLKKTYALYSNFSSDDKAMTTALKLSDIQSNEQKAEYLKELKTKDRELYNKILKLGRKTIETETGNESYILISDTLLEML